MRRVCLHLALLATWSLGASVVAAQDTIPEASTFASDGVSVEDAPEAPPRPSELRVGVLLLPTGDVDPATTDALTELLIASIASRGSPQIVGKEEMQALLGRDDAAMLECMESALCLSIAGVELGVREIISGTLGRREGSWMFIVERVDVRTGEVAGRVFRVVDGELDSLIDALADSVPELYVEPVLPGRIVLHTDAAGAEVRLDGEPIGVTEAGGPFRRELVPPGIHELMVVAPGYEPWSRTVEVPPGASLVLDAVLLPASHHFEVPALTWTFGITALVALGSGLALGAASEAAVSESATMREFFSFFDARGREAIAANILYAFSGAFAVAAIVPLVLAAIDEPAPTSVALVPQLHWARGQGGLELDGLTLSLGGHF